MYGSVLAYNGEVFGGLDVVLGQNDGQVLMQALCSGAPGPNPLHPGAGASAATDHSIIPGVLSGLRGPWAVLFWDARTHTLWFGRDVLGRRSLLLRWPTPQQPFLTLTSVAPDRPPQPQPTSLAGSTTQQEGALPPQPTSLAGSTNLPEGDEDDATAEGAPIVTATTWQPWSAQQRDGWQEVPPGLYSLSHLSRDARDRRDDAIGVTAASDVGGQSPPDCSPCQPPTQVCCDLGGETWAFSRHAWTDPDVVQLAAYQRPVQLVQPLGQPAVPPPGSVPRNNAAALNRAGQAQAGGTAAGRGSGAAAGLADVMETVAQADGGGVGGADNQSQGLGQQPASVVVPDPSQPGLEGPGLPADKGPATTAGDEGLQLQGSKAGRGAGSKGKQKPSKAKRGRGGPSVLDGVGGGAGEGAGAVGACPEAKYGVSPESTAALLSALGAAVQLRCGNIELHDATTLAAAPCNGSAAVPCTLNGPTPGALNHTIQLQPPLPGSAQPYNEPPQPNHQPPQPNHQPPPHTNKPVTSSSSQHPTSQHAPPTPTRTLPPPLPLSPTSASLDNDDAPVLILFSGGVDSTLIAALAHQALPPHVPIDLSNVCFDGGRSPDRLAAISALGELRVMAPERRWRLILTDASLRDVDENRAHILQLLHPAGTVMDLNIGSALWLAVRARGRLHTPPGSQPPAKPTTTGQIAPVHSQANGVMGHGQQGGGAPTQAQAPQGIPCQDVVEAACQGATASHQPPAAGQGQGVDAGCQGAATTVKPAAGQGQSMEAGCQGAATTVAAVKPAGGGGGMAAGCQNAGGQQQEYCSKARVVLLGHGADEQCAGYGRHRTRFAEGGWSRLSSELALDVTRLWLRNLGRDDRLVSDWGREARHPFLDESFMAALLNQIPLHETADLYQPPGVGDKRVLRAALAQLGLPLAAARIKRAIQFGSRIGKLSNVREFGSNRRANKASAGGVALTSLPQSQDPAVNGL